MQTYPKRPGQPSPELTQGHESQHAPPSPSHPILSPPPPPRFNSLQQISTEAHSGLAGAWPTQWLWASELMQVREAQPPCPSCSSPPNCLHLLRSDCEHHTEEGREKGILWAVHGCALRLCPVPCSHTCLGCPW